MRISEVIKRLEEILKADGDLPVKTQIIYGPLDGHRDADEDTFRSLGKNEYVEIQS